MEGDFCYSYMPSQHNIPTYANTNVSFSDRIVEEEPINDLELHFNTLFMLEAEKGRYNKVGNSKNNVSDNVKCYTILDEPKRSDNKGIYNKTNNVTYKTTNFGDNLKYTERRYANNNSSTDYTNNFTSTPEKNADFVEGNWKNYQNIQNSSSEFWNDRPIGSSEIFMDNFADRLTPESIPDETLTTLNVNKCPLPPLEAAFSKHFSKTAGLTNFNNFDNCFTSDESKNLCINNLDNYYYPNNLNNESATNIEKKDSRKNEYTKLFESINYDENVEDIDTYFKPNETEKQGDNSKDLNDSGSLMDDLDSLSYYQDDDDDMVGFEEYYSPSECQDYETFETELDNKNKTTDLTSKTSNVAATEISDQRVCFWLKCDLSFSCQTTLVEHIEKVHVNSYKGDEFICLWSCCARAARPFNARYKLLIHMRVHSGHKPNVCMHTGCGKAFSRLENLKIHRRSHTGERPYRCQAPRCSKAFSNSSDRAKHQRTHFNARPYACQIDGCNKRYTDPSSLRKHVKNHSSVPMTYVTSSTSVQARSKIILPAGQTKKSAQPQASHKVLNLDPLTTQKKITNTKLINKIAQNQSKAQGVRTSRRLQTISEEKEEIGQEKRKRIDDENNPDKMYRKVTRIVTKTSIIVKNSDNNLKNVFEDGINIVKNDKKSVDHFKVPNQFIVNVDNVLYRSNNDERIINPMVNYEIDPNNGNHLKSFTNSVDHNVLNDHCQMSKPLNSNYLDNTAFVSNVDCQRVVDQYNQNQIIDQNCARSAIDHQPDIDHFSNINNDDFMNVLGAHDYGVANWCTREDGLIVEDDSSRENYISNELNILYYDDV